MDTARKTYSEQLNRWVGIESLSWDGDAGEKGDGKFQSEGFPLEDNMEGQGRGRCPTLREEEAALDDLFWTSIPQVMSPPSPFQAVLGGSSLRVCSRWTLLVELGSEYLVSDRIRRRLSDPRCPPLGLRLCPISALPARVFVEAAGSSLTHDQHSFLYRLIGEASLRMSQMKAYDWIQVCEGSHKDCLGIIVGVHGAAEPPNVHLYDALILPFVQRQEQIDPGRRGEAVHRSFMLFRLTYLNCSGRPAVMPSIIQPEPVLLKSKHPAWFEKATSCPTPRDIRALRNATDLRLRLDLFSEAFDRPWRQLNLGDRVLIVAGEFEGYRGVVCAVPGEDVVVKFLQFELEKQYPSCDVRQDFVYGDYVRIMAGDSEGVSGWVAGFELGVVLVLHVESMKLYEVDPADLAFETEHSADKNLGHGLFGVPDGSASPLNEQGPLRLDASEDREEPLAAVAARASGVAYDHGGQAQFVEQDVVPLGDLIGELDASYDLTSPSVGGASPFEFLPSAELTLEEEHPTEKESARGPFGIPDGAESRRNEQEPPRPDTEGHYELPPAVATQASSLAYDHGDQGVEHDVNPTDQHIGQINVSYGLTRPEVMQPSASLIPFAPGVLGPLPEPVGPTPGTPAHGQKLCLGNV
ncbi:hypothetical protein NMY22_g11666 [Coprinellus aureogranulatus]|nr:hypothetical protein NMY22_g11666 [Coprinellus aureogranulatus]